MKKLLLSLALLLCATQTYAQDSVGDTTDAPDKSYMYAQLLGTSKLFSNKVTVQVDFGQFRRMGSDQRMVDKEGNPIVFNSMVDAMNYMGANGWQFLQAYAITIGNQSVYHWLLRLDLDTLNEAEKMAVMEQLKTKKMLKDEAKK